MDPRMRDRRVTVIREAGRRRLRRLVFVLCLVAAAGIGTGIVLSPVLDVNQIEVTGVDAAHAAEVRAATRIDRGEALLLVDTGAVTVRVEELIWVDEVDVVRELPGTLRVDVTPRFPVAWRIDAHGAIQLIDSRGVAIMPTATPPLGLPELQVGADDLAVAARTARAVPEALAPYVGRIAVTAGEASVWLTSGTEVQLGAPSDLDAKLRAAHAVLSALGGVPVAYVNVEVPSAPVTG
jgi:cell division protein FtsQ